MPASTRILVVDSDAASQGDIQGILVSNRFIVLGGTEIGEETVTMARAFQPQVILLNLDDGEESYRVADLIAGEFPEAHLLAYSRRKDTEPLDPSAWADVEERPIKVVPTEERALLAAIQSALTGQEEIPEEQAPEEQAPVAADDADEEARPSPQMDSPGPVAWRDELAAPPWSGEGAEPFLRRFAETASEWLLTRSPRAEERFLATLAEDVQAPSFGGSGRDAVRQGLEGLAWRLGNAFRLVPSDLDGEPVLAVMVETRDGRWHRAGYFVVRVGDANSISYFNYLDDEPSGKPDPEAS
jgi:DNA-binding NarL/FixJ family response regulator